MITLCGFALSNYYNKVKLALLEKGIPFDERLVWADRAPALLEKSPFGKVPFIETEHGVLCESQVIADYLEQTYPSVPLLPADPFAAAKLRELIAFLELNIELVARELYGAAFFGGTATDETKQRVHKLLVRNVAAFSKRARFAPYIGGAEFTLADCAGLVHLPLVSLASKIVLGEDVLEALPVREYLQKLAERPHVQSVNAARKACQEQMAAQKAKPA